MSPDATPPSSPGGDKPRFFFSYDGKTAPIAGELTLGSGESCGLVIAGKNVEALTAVARIDGDEVVLETRAKEHEAKVNGKLLSLAELEDGTEVTIGGIEMTVEVAGTDVALKGAEGRFPLKVGANLVGRTPESTVVLDDPSVSRKHALVLVLPGGQVRLRDLGSSNGTWVGERQMGRATLQHGDKVEIGGTTLTFLSGPAMAAKAGRATGAGGGAAADPSAEAGSRSDGLSKAASPVGESVRPVDSTGTSEPPKPAKPPLDATVIAGSAAAVQAEEAAADDPGAPLFELVVDGEPRRLRAGQELVIGRAPECDLALTDDDQASRRHARLSVLADEMRIEDLGSSNGTRLNGAPLDRAAGPITLTDGDRVGVGRKEMEVRITRPVDPHGATVLAPGGLDSLAPGLAGSVAPGPGGAAGVGGAAGAGAFSGRPPAPPRPPGQRPGDGEPPGGGFEGAGHPGAGHPGAGQYGAGQSGTTPPGAGGAAPSSGGGGAEAPPAAAPGPSAEAGPRPLPTDRASALAILDLPPGAHDDLARRRYQELVSEFRIRHTNAPTPDLKNRYARRLEELRSAAAILLPPAAEEDLPVSRPVDAPLPPGRAAAESAASGPVAPPPGAPAGGRGKAAPDAGAAGARGGGGASAAAASAGAAPVTAAPPATGGSGGVPKSTWLMLAVTLVLLLATLAFAFLYRQAAAVETGLRDDLAATEAELASMTARIPQAGSEFEALQQGLAAKLENHELKICNQGSQDLVVTWLHAAFVKADGSFEAFDSAQFGYPPWRIPGGGTQKFEYVSGDRVIFDSNAVFFAVTFRYGNEEFFRSGAVADLSADCYVLDLDQ